MKVIHSGIGQHAVFLTKIMIH